jgi:hypothetical protein
LILGVAVNGEVTQEDIATVNRALATAVQLDNRCAKSTDCTTVAVGSRACGGPNGYVVYSILSSNAQDIRSLAQLTTKLEHEYNADNSVVSICSLVMPPKPMCDETEKCVAESKFSPSEEIVF